MNRGKIIDQTIVVFIRYCCAVFNSGQVMLIFVTSRVSFNLVLIGMTGSGEKQKELRPGNQTFFRLAGLEKGKYQNRCYVPRISVQCQGMTPISRTLGLSILQDFSSVW